MLMLMMKKKGSLAVLALLLASAGCILPPSTDDLNGEFGSTGREAADGGLFKYSCDSQRSPSWERSTWTGRSKTPSTA